MRFLCLMVGLWFMFSYPSNAIEVTHYRSIPPNLPAFCNNDTEILEWDTTTNQYVCITKPRGTGTVGTKHDGYIIADPAEIQTTDATVTVLGTLTLLDENTYQIEALVVGVQSDGTNRASYHLAVTVYRTGAGLATIQGSVTSLHTQESDVTWDATFTISSNDVRVSVTGVAATTIEWGSTLTYINMSN